MVVATTIARHRVGGTGLSGAGMLALCAIADFRPDRVKASGPGTQDSLVLVIRTSIR